MSAQPFKLSFLVTLAVLPPEFCPCISNPSVLKCPLVWINSSFWTLCRACVLPHSVHKLNKQQKPNTLSLKCKECLWAAFTVALPWEVHCKQHRLRPSQACAWSSEGVSWVGGRARMQKRAFLLKLRASPLQLAYSSCFWLLAVSRLPAREYFLTKYI